MYKIILKRVLDILISIILLVLTSPIIVLTFFILSFQNSGRPLFFQERPGKDLKPFKIVKFKTMNDRKDEFGNLLPDNVRLTFFGRWIRKLSIDELPQIFNVLKGDMSLIGPRPLLNKYVPLYSKEQLRRHEIRPGITGWAQVNGRNSISWKKKFELDIEYIDRISFFLDCRIIYITIIKIIRTKGVNQSIERPMRPFDGTN
jgi:lipopolysaccharide/colanic/teichoic acid biosynthesis glycosyltransferase